MASAVLPELRIDGLDGLGEEYFSAWWIPFDRPSIAPDDGRPAYGWLGLHAREEDARITRSNLISSHGLREDQVEVRSLTLPEAFELVRNLPRPIPTRGRAPFDGLLGVVVVDREPDGELALRLIPA